MKKHIFWRLFKAAVLTTVVWSVITLDVYGWNNNSNSGGTLLDVFRGRSNTSESTPPPVAQPSNAGYGTPVVPAPKLTNVNGYGQPQTVVETPHNHNHGSQYGAPAPAMQQGTPQNKWSLTSWLSGAAPVQPQSQYVEPAPPLEPAYTPPPSPEPQAVMPSGMNGQYPVVPLDSEDFRPQEGAIYNEKGEIIYFPNGSEPNFEGSGGEMVYDNNSPMAYPQMQEALPMEQNIPPVSQSASPITQNIPATQNALPMTQSIPPTQSASPMTESIPPTQSASPIMQNIPATQSAPSTQNAPDSTAKRIIMGRSGAGRSSLPVNQERVYPQGQGNPNRVITSRPEPIPAQIPVNPYAQQPTTAVGRSPVGTVINSDNFGSLNLNSGSAAFSKTYTPGPVRTSVPTEPVMDMAAPQLSEALPQVGNREQGSNSPETNLSPAVGAPTPETSPIIEELHNDSPLENLTEKNSQTPALEPIPEIDIPKEKLGNSEQGVGNSDSPSANSTPLATRNAQLATDNRLAASQLATSQTDNRQETADSIDSPSTRHSSPLTPNSPTPLIIEISGPDEVEFGKTEMFSLSVINTTDAVRRDVALSVHPEGFGEDKTASVNLEQLEPGEKKSVYMKLNARQYNNLSLTAQVRDAQGFETTKTISVNVKNESVKISILPPQTGNVYVGQPTEYLIRIVNNSPKDIMFNAMAFFGNGIEPIRASGAPNTIQSGQVVVDKPIELKQGEMRDLKIVAIAFQPGIHKILVQVIDSSGATYAAKESCAYRQREFDNDDSASTEKDARIELTPGKSEFGVWKPAGPAGVRLDNRQETIDSSEGIRQETVDSSDSPSVNLNTPSSLAPVQNAPDAVPLTQPDQGSRGDLIMPMFAQ
ncbi:MAG: hypothetical protein IJQ39_00480 [Thermoguttaceae bacterium]|nr:hypothetical protein [Thermoguttaceae bacterium]